MGLGPTRVVVRFSTARRCVFFTLSRVKVALVLAGLVFGEDDPRLLNGGVPKGPLHSDDTDAQGDPGSVVTTHTPQLHAWGAPTEKDER
jgi:hypothetical protein